MIFKKSESTLHTRLNYLLYCLCFSVLWYTCTFTVDRVGAVLLSSGGCCSKGWGLAGDRLSDLGRSVALATAHPGSAWWKGLTKGTRTSQHKQVRSYCCHLFCIRFFVTKIIHIQPVNMLTCCSYIRSTNGLSFRVWWFLVCVSIVCDIH